MITYFDPITDKYVEFNSSTIIYLVKMSDKYTIRAISSELSKLTKDPTTNAESYWLMDPNQVMTINERDGNKLFPENVLTTTQFTLDEVKNNFCIDPTVINPSFFNLQPRQEFSFPYPNSHNTPARDIRTFRFPYPNSRSNAMHRARLFDPDRLVWSSRYARLSQEQQEYVTNNENQVIEALREFGLTDRRVLQQLRRNPRRFNGREKDLLIYLVTGVPPEPMLGIPLSDLERLPASNRLTLEQAFCELADLNWEQMNALQHRWHKGLRGQHLRDWQPDVRASRAGFSLAHLHALDRLVEKGVEPTNALLMLNETSKERASQVAREYGQSKQPSRRLVRV